MSYNGSVNHSDRQLRGNIRQTTAQNNEAVSPIGEDYIPRFSEQCSATSGYMEIQQQSISHDQQHDASSENHLLPNTVELNVPLDPMPRKRMTKPNVKDKLITWWWWWEIMAMVLSFACMCAIVVLLTKIDNIPLQSWWLPIQPNSLIAALTTIGKAALMVPAASCISQLKWRHFFLRPRGLADLELFDEASRGPWGSALLIARLCLRPHVLVVMGFAFVTIVALGIDTAIQQVLDFPLRATPLDNSTIEMGVANDYFSKGFIEIPDHSFIWQPNVDLPAVQAAIINGANGQPSEPFFECPEPASRCEWTAFTTLGVCTEFQNISELVTPKCNTSTTRTGMDCTYTSPDPPYGDGIPVTMTMHWDPENSGQGQAMLFQSAFNQTLNYTSTMPASLGTFMSIKAYGDGSTVYTDDGKEVPPAADIGLGTFTWCVQTFHNATASQSGINPGYMTSERIGTQEDIAPPEIGAEENKMNADYYTYRLNSTGQTYNISRMSARSWPEYLQYVLDTTIYHESSRPNPASGYTLQLGYTYYKGDTAAVIHNIGTAISNQMRSSSPGDNYNATVVEGTALFMETYIIVRWPWMILPLVETVLAALLLIISIVVSQKQPLLKTSVIAYLTARLDGWEDEELSVAGAHRLTQEHLEGLASGLKAQLEVHSEGRLTFTREDDSLKHEPNV